MKLNKSVALLALSLLLLSGCGNTDTQSAANSTTPTNINSSVTTSTAVNPVKIYTFPGVLTNDQIQNKQVRITTAKGDIVFELYNETAPMAVSNFVYLTNEGYYDGLIFHRRDEGFVIQGGDPLGTGRGGPGYRFNDELSDDYTYERGIVAMANAGSNTNGSQFFIMLADTPLPKKYTIFGRVTEGLEVVDQIKIGDEMVKVTVEDKK
ncbi:MAG: peptidylprolyl isomerase [Patescibacteria group bacterium]|jgi:peptidyl-prolyl cis-trans isomerase B (cyclophilin B)